MGEAPLYIKIAVTGLLSSGLLTFLGYVFTGWEGQEPDIEGVLAVLIVLGLIVFGVTMIAGLWGFAN